MMGRPMLRLDERLAEYWKYVELAKELGKADQIGADVLRPLDGAQPWVNTTLAALRKRRQKAIGHPEREERAALVGRAVFDQEGAGSSYGSQGEIGLPD